MFKIMSICEKLLIYVSSAQLTESKAKNRNQLLFYHENDILLQIFSSSIISKRTILIL